MKYFLLVPALYIIWVFTKSLVFLGLSKEINQQEKTLLTKEVFRAASGPLIYKLFYKEFDIHTGLVPKSWIDLVVAINFVIAFLIVGFLINFL